MNLSAIEYCEMFRMDQPRYNFNREIFINKFGSDFLNSCQHNGNINPNTGYLRYKAFKSEISDAQKVFNEISKLVEESGKQPLSKGLWNAFYATYVIPVRKAIFKDIQEKIDHKKRIAESQWAPLKELRDKLLRDKLKSDEDKTKIKPEGKGKRNP